MAAPASQEELDFFTLTFDESKSRSALARQMIALPLASQIYSINYILGVLMKAGLPRKRAVGSVISTAANNETGRQFLRDPDAAAESAIMKLAENEKPRAKFVGADLVRLPSFIVDRLSALHEYTRAHRRAEFTLPGSHLAEKSRRSGWASVGDLHKMFGGDNKFWVARCEAGRIPGAVCGKARGRRKWQVPQAAVEEIALFFRMTLSVDEAAGRLRIAPYQVRALERLGLLRSCFMGCGDLLRRFPIDAVDHVTQTLLALSESQRHKQRTRRAFPLSYVSKSERRLGKARQWERHVEKVFAGTVPVWQISPLTALGFAAFAAPWRTLTRAGGTPPL